MEFRWNDWNLDHIAKHGVTSEEAEGVCRNARRPYPRDIGDGKFIAWGKGSGGRFLQVIFITDEDGTLYVIHSRRLNDNEKRLFCRNQR